MLLLNQFMQSLLASSECTVANVNIVADNANIKHTKYQKGHLVDGSKLSSSCRQSHGSQTPKLCRWDQNRNLDLALDAPKRAGQKYIEAKSKGLVMQRFHSAPNLHIKSLSLPRMPQRTVNIESPTAVFSQRKMASTAFDAPAFHTMPIRECASSVAIVHLDKQLVTSSSPSKLPNHPQIHHSPVRPTLSASFSPKVSPNHKMREILGSLAPRSASMSEKRRPRLRGSSKIRRTPTPAQRLSDATSSSFREERQLFATSPNSQNAVIPPQRKENFGSSSDNASWSPLARKPKAFQLNSTVCMVPPSA